MAAFGKRWRRDSTSRGRQKYLVAMVAVVLGVGAVVGTVAWRGSDDAPSSRDRFVDAYATGLEVGTAISGDDARCLAQATVEAVGAATLAEATSVDATRASPALVPSELGITVDQSQGEAYYEALSECADPRQQFSSLLGNVEAGCFDQRIDEALLRELVVAWFTSAAEISANLDAALTDVYESCSTEPTGGRPQPKATNRAGLRNSQPLQRRESQTFQASVRVINYNVRGLLRDVVRQTFVDSNPRRFTEVVGDEVARQQADFVLLQEVCGSQAELIAQRSSAEGHPMYLRAMTTLPPSADRYPEASEICAEVSGIASPPGAAIPYGKAILVTDPNASAIDPPGGAPAQCVRARSPQPVRVCNVHLPEGDTRIRPAESWWLSSEPLIVGGDFNTTPAIDPMPHLYTSMHEALSTNVPSSIQRLAASTAFTPVPYKKIDYIFADEMNFDELSAGYIQPMRCFLYKFCSDHVMLTGDFTFSASEFPPQIDPSVHGGSASAVYLAVSDSYDDPQISAAEAAARSVGYEAAAGDLGCDVGAAEALGRGIPFAAAVAVYFDNEEDARLARDAFESRGVRVVGVANVSLVCLD